jgi:hypothetical protein
MVVLVAADRLAAGPVKMGQATDAAADQDRMHRGGSQPDLGAMWAGPSRWVQRRCTIRRTTGAGVRRGLWWGRLDRSAIPDRSQVAIAGGPSMRGWAADPEPLGGPGDRPALVHDGPGQPQPTELAQGCVRVSHEDLLGPGWVLGSSTTDPEVLPQINSTQPNWPCTNLPGQYT